MSCWALLIDPSGLQEAVAMMAGDKVHPELSREEALVLFEWLSRFNNAEDAKFQDQAEQRVLWDLEGMLESTLVDPFDPNYGELLAQAREKVRDPEVRNPRFAVQPGYELELLGAAMSRRTVGVQVHLLSTSKGGRSRPVLSGYRSLLRFEGTEADFGFELDLDPGLGSEGIAPGASGTGRISFWATDELPALFPGQKFELHEGTRVVGHGAIVDS